MKKLASRLDLPIVNVRYHLEPWKRFQKPPPGHYGGRVTIMLQEQAGAGMICQDWRPRRKSASEWEGMTLFFRKEVKKDQKAYVEMQDGVYEVMVSDQEEWRNLCFGGGQPSFL